MQGRLGSFRTVHFSWAGAGWWDVTLSSTFLSNCVKSMILFPAIHTSELHPSFVSWDSCIWTFWPVTAFIHLQCHASKAISTHALSKLSCSGTPCPLCHHQHSKILPVYCFHPPSWLVLIRSSQWHAKLFSWQWCIMLDSISQATFGTSPGSQAGRQLNLSPSISGWDFMGQNEGYRCRPLSQF